MMAAMMLPAAAPVLLLYAGSVKAGGSGVADLWLLAAGYAAVWAAFSVAVTALQRTLASMLILTPMMEASSARAGAAVLLVAGLYQLTPLKQACLRVCRSPLSFLMQRTGTGTGGAFRIGVEHGLHCLGCCWALMLLLFAGGVMNLMVILALTVWVLVEKLAPFGERAASLAGIALIGTAAWMVYAAAV
jgi:predicted metal-binding membrane protein